MKDASVAIGYVRVSSEEQFRDGVSLDAQKAKLKAWASLHEARLIETYEDAGISGKRADNRPALQQAITAACRAKCPLVVTSLSRLSRSVRDTLTLSEIMERAGADLVSLSERLDTTTASGKMVLRLMAVLAEFERDQLVERTRMAMAHMRRQGRRISRHLPFGWQASADGSALVADEAEQKALRLLLSLRRQGLSLSQVASRLNDAGIAPKRATRWRASSVHAVLCRAEQT